VITGNCIENSDFYHFRCAALDVADFSALSESA